MADTQLVPASAFSSFPTIEIVEPRAPRPVRADVITIPTESPPTSRRRRNGAVGPVRKTAKRKRTRSARGTLRKRVRSFSKSVKKATLRGVSFKRKGKARLTLGRAVIGVVLGVATALAIDTAVSRLLTRKRGYRALILGGATLLVWFGGAYLGGPWTAIAQAFAAGHALTAVVVLGIDAVNTAGTAPTQPTSGA